MKRIASSVKRKEWKLNCDDPIWLHNNAITSDHEASFHAANSTR